MENCNCPQCNNGWISVDDRLPVQGRVLVYSPGFKVDFEYRLVWYDQVLKCSDATHWMPLPTSPQESENHEKT